MKVGIIGSGCSGGEQHLSLGRQDPVGLAHGNESIFASLGCARVLGCFRHGDEFRGTANDLYSIGRRTRPQHCLVRRYARCLAGPDAARWSEAGSTGWPLARALRGRLNASQFVKRLELCQLQSGASPPREQ
jgi:hypothetical protein